MSVRPFAATLAALLLTLSVGCARAPLATPTALRPIAPAAAAAGVPDEGPATKEAFVAAAKAKGVKLSEADLGVIQAERTVKPNGTWAPRPAENLTAEQNLDVHFRKHGHEFRPAITSAEAYMAQANAAGDGGRGEVRYFFDTTSFQKGYQSHVVRWVPKTIDFTAFRADGAQTTYYRNVPKGNRFIEVPVW